VELDRLLADHPGHAEALATRARASRALGLHRAAAEDFARAIAAEEALGRTTPEHYLERAGALAAEGGDAVAEALHALDEGLGRLGPIPALQLYAIDLELVRSRYDAALARLDAVAAQSPRSGPWLARRGEVLERAGRPADARAAYEQALADLASVTAGRRRTGGSARLERQVRAALERLQRQEQAEAKP
jgi:predicted Zn-dependent protease